jgi:hypothetical protein
MPDTKVKRTTVARKAPATRKRPAARSRERQRASAVGRTTNVPDEVLRSVESAQRAAIDAVHKFVDIVDEKLPAAGDGHPSRRQEIVDAALDMSDRLVRTQYEFLRSLVDSAGKTLRRGDDRR